MQESVGPNFVYGPQFVQDFEECLEEIETRVCKKEECLEEIEVNFSCMLERERKK